VSARQPPRLATWLVQRLASGRLCDALLGDLFEEYQRGRSPGWYWRQVGAVLLHACLRVVRALLPDSIATLLQRTTKRLLAILVVTALGLGTLTWAATTYTPACPAHASCHKAR
jgi:hypothetical protein